VPTRPKSFVGASICPATRSECALCTVFLLSGDWCLLRSYGKHSIRIGSFMRLAIEAGDSCGRRTHCMEIGPYPDWHDDHHHRTGGVEQNGPYVAGGKHTMSFRRSALIVRAMAKLNSPIVKFVPEGKYRAQNLRSHEYAEPSVWSLALRACPLNLPQLQVHASWTSSCLAIAVGTDRYGTGRTPESTMVR